MKVGLPIDVSNLQSDDPEFTKYVSQLLSAIVTVINGEVDLTDNCKASFVTIAFNAANTPQAVTHTLNKIPRGYIQVGAKAAAQVYNGLLPNTKTILYVQSSIATTVSLLVF